MCGIVGIVGHTPANQQIYDALTVLQHRGQDAAGIMTYHDGELFLRAALGDGQDTARPLLRVAMRAAVADETEARDLGFAAAAELRAQGADSYLTAL